MYSKITDLNKNNKRDDLIHVNRYDKLKKTGNHFHYKRYIFDFNYELMFS